MTADGLPPEVAELLARRSEARAARDWAQADALRDRIHELGWEPIDSPSGSTARPAPGRAADAGSRLDEPASRAASVVVLAEDHPEDVQRFRAGMQSHPPRVDWELLVVANAPPVDPDPAGATVLHSSQRLGWADAANLGLRAAAGALIVLVDSSVEPAGAWLDELLVAFDDPSVGVAGPWGLTTADLRQFEEAPPGEVHAIEAYCMVIRREALRTVGGFEHRFRYYRNADLDLSFAIRDAGWRAVRTEPLPLLRHEHRGWTSLPPEERERLSRRNFYRFLKRWGGRRDLIESVR